MGTAKATKTALAAELGVSRSSLYYKPKKPPSDEMLRTTIEAVMAEHSAYGHRRIAIHLEMNKKPVLRVMHIFGLKPRIRRGVRFVKPDDLGRPDTFIPNILKALCPIRPNVVWAGDFTYLWHVDRFWYVATVIDVFTREIVGWHVSNHHTTALIVEAFKDAVRRAKAAPTWFHSDQGSEYVSGAYESLLAAYRTVASQSRKGSPWQNGFQESFYSGFKLELGNIKRFNHVGELIEAVHQQIGYYNTQRIHSALKMPPAQYRERQKQKMTALAAPIGLVYSTGLLVKSV
jgi:putative transposase